MAIAQPEIEWFYDPSTYFAKYGLMCLTGKWAVVEAKDYAKENYRVITDWVDKPTAVGFLKLLKEK